MSNQRREIVELYHGGKYLVATGGAKAPPWPPIDTQLVANMGKHELTVANLCKHK